MLEKTLESPLDCKEIKPVNPKGNQPWIFIGRTDAEAEAPILWPPDAKSWLIRKDPDAGKDWGQEEKGTTEYKMVGWHHQLNRHEFEQTVENSEGQRSLVCSSPWGRKETGVSDWTELNWISGMDLSESSSCIVDDIRRCFFFKMPLEGGSSPTIGINSCSRNEFWVIWGHSMRCWYFLSLWLLEVNIILIFVGWLVSVSTVQLSHCNKSSHRQYNFV